MRSCHIITKRNKNIIRKGLLSLLIKIPETSDILKFSNIVMNEGKKVEIPRHPFPLKLGFFLITNLNLNIGF